MTALPAKRSSSFAAALFLSVLSPLQDLMKSAPDVTNVVEACAEGRQERLDSMLQQLELCEKALQVRLTS